MKTIRIPCFTAHEQVIIDFKAINQISLWRVVHHLHRVLHSPGLPPLALCLGLIFHPTQPTDRRPRNAFWRRGGEQNCLEMHNNTSIKTTSTYFKSQSTRNGVHALTKSGKKITTLFNALGRKKGTPRGSCEESHVPICDVIKWRTDWLNYKKRWTR